jgi:hypothetical protein
MLINYDSNSLEKDSKSSRSLRLLQQPALLVEAKRLAEILELVNIQPETPILAEF